MKRSTDCCYSEDELYPAATGRSITADQKRAYRQMSQAERNREVRRLVNLTDGKWSFEDRVGTNGVVYTAYAPADENSYRCVVVESKISEPARDSNGRVIRGGFECLLPSAAEYGVQDFDRSHAIGARLGSEFAEGVRLAHQRINRSYMSNVEAFVEDLFHQKAPDVEIWMSVSVRSFPRTLFLREVEYTIDAERDGTRYRLIEVAVTVNAGNMATATVDVRAARDIEPFLNGIPDRRSGHY